MKNPHALTAIHAHPSSALAVVEYRAAPPQLPRRSRMKWLGRAMGWTVAFVAGISAGAGAFKVKSDQDARAVDSNHSAQMTTVNGEVEDLEIRYQGLSQQMQTLTAQNQELVVRLNLESARSNELHAMLGQEEERSNQLLRRAIASEERNEDLAGRNTRLASKINRLETTIDNLREQGGARIVRPIHIARPDSIRGELEHFR